MTNGGYMDIHTLDRRVNKQENGPHKKVAFLVAELWHIFTRKTVEGVMHVLSDENQVDLLVVPVKFIGRSEFEGADKFEFQYQTSAAFLRRENVDLLIVSADTIGCMTDEAHIRDFLGSLKDIPVMLIASDYDDYPSVNFKNQDGIREGLEYLIEKEGVRKICMLGGNDMTYDTRSRKAVWQQILKEHGLICTDDMYEPTNMQPTCRMEATRLLDRNPDTEAVFCVNDNVAVALYDVMRQRGMEPGKEIKVMGVDNAPNSAIMTPSLSTVDADAYELGKQTGLMALAFLAGEKVGKKLVTARFILRDSFGKTEADVTYSQSMMLEETELERNFDEIFEQIVQLDMATAAFFRKRFVEVMGHTIYYVLDGVHDKAVMQDILTQAEHFFTYALEYADLDKLLSFLDTIHNNVMQSCDDPEIRSMSNEVRAALMRKITMVMSNNKLEQADKNTDTIQSLKTLVHESLGFTYGNDLSYRLMISNLQWMGVKNACVYIYEKPIVHLEYEVLKLPETLRLKAVLRDGELVDIPYANQQMPISRLFSNAYLTKKTQKLVMLPLFFGDTLYGMMLVDLMDMVFTNGDFLANLMGSVVRMIDLLRENNEIQKKLEESVLLLRQNNIELDQLSKKDVLTGTLNRRGFIEAAEKYIEENQREGKSCLVAYVDMNNLKVINDRFGHEEGDFALKAIGRVLGEIITDGVIARIGGDEYAFICGSGHFRKQLAEQIRKGFEEFNQKSEKPYYVSVSCGFYRIGPKERISLSDAMAMADSQLYVAKQNKDNRILK